MDNVFIAHGPHACRDMQKRVGSVQKYGQAIHAPMLTNVMGKARLPWNE